MLEERTCLNCRYLSEPNEPHIWHRCEWKKVVPVACIQIRFGSIHIKKPHANCPTWEPHDV